MATYHYYTKTPGPVASGNAATIGAATNAAGPAILARREDSEVSAGINTNLWPDEARFRYTSTTAAAVPAALPTGAVLADLKVTA